MVNMYFGHVEKDTSTNKPLLKLSSNTLWVFVSSVSYAIAGFLAALWWLRKCVVADRWEILFDALALFHAVELPLSWVSVLRAGDL